MTETLYRALQEYKEKFRRQGLADLDVSPLYSLFPSEESQSLKAMLAWPEEYPNSSRKGVYVIFGKSGRLLYVGKASMNHSIGSRLGNYFHQEKLTRACIPIHTGWSERPSYLLTIGVPDDMSFEAPALEEFLIERLDPPDNSVGRRSSQGPP